MSTLTTTIAGRDYTISRPFSDRAEVWVRRDDGANFAVSAQYAFVDGVANPRAFSGLKALDDTFADGAELLPIATEIVAAARAYLAGERDLPAVTPDPVVAPVPETMPAHVATLFGRYADSDAAWDAGDEHAAILMQPYD